MTEALGESFESQLNPRPTGNNLAIMSIVDSIIKTFASESTDKLTTSFSSNPSNKPFDTTSFLSLWQLIELSKNLNGKKLVRPYEIHKPKTSLKIGNIRSQI